MKSTDETRIALSNLDLATKAVLAEVNAASAKMRITDGSQDKQALEAELHSAWKRLGELDAERETLQAELRRLAAQAAE